MKGNSIKSSIQKSLIVTFLLSVSFVFLSCRSDDDSKTNNDEYYVKYEVNSSTIYSNGMLKVEYFTENNQFITTEIPTKKLWEINVGPVKKDFKAQIRVSQLTENYGRLTLSSKIYTSKNNSPFAIKKEDVNSTPRTLLLLDYTIDY